MSVLSAPPDRIQRQDVSVMEHSTADKAGCHPAGLALVRANWWACAGGKMFARVDERAGTYTVCTPVTNDDHPERLGLSLGTLAGGYYLRGRLTGATRRDLPAHQRRHERA